MKKTFIFLMLLLVNFHCYAAKINKIIFFGDSLSDNGNLYSLLLHIIPKSPPYFNGRFSNGQTWAENLGNYYHDKNKIDYQIYAVGGATAVFHWATSKFIAPTTLELEVDKYLLDYLFEDKRDTLFVIWIGGNDYLFSENVNVQSYTDKVVNKIAWAIDTLQYYGGSHFLILNLPDLSKIPKAQGSGSEAQLQALSIVHNQKLDKVIHDIQSAHHHINVSLIDVYNILNDMMADPGKYNEKYHINIVNTSAACWTGGLFISKALSSHDINYILQKQIIANSKGIGKPVDAKIMSDYITSSPSLMYSYQLAQSYELGNVPCVNPDEYLFWDEIHPTAVVHRVLAQMMIENLNSQIG